MSNLYFLFSLPEKYLHFFASQIAVLLHSEIQSECYCFLYRMKKAKPDIIEVILSKLYYRSYIGTMEIHFLHPIDFCIGKFGYKSEFYCRRNKNGKVFMQHCPRSKSRKQIAWHQEFVARYAGQKIPPPPRSTSST